MQHSTVVNMHASGTPKASTDTAARYASRRIFIRHWPFPALVLQCNAVQQFIQKIMLDVVGRTSKYALSFDYDGTTSSDCTADCMMFQHRYNLKREGAIPQAI